LRCFQLVWLHRADIGPQHSCRHAENCAISTQILSTNARLRLDTRPPAEGSTRSTSGTFPTTSRCTQCTRDSSRGEPKRFTERVVSRRSRSSDTQVTSASMKRYSNLSESWASTCTTQSMCIVCLRTRDQIAATVRSLTSAACLRHTGSHLRDEPNMIRRPPEIMSHLRVTICTTLLFVHPSSWRWPL